MNKTTLLTCLLLLAGTALAHGQSRTSRKVVGAEVTHAQFMGKTLPLRQLIPVSTVGPNKRKQMEMEGEAPENFFGRGKRRAPQAGALPREGDPLRQSTIPRSSGLVVEPGINVEGLQSSFGSPQDPTGDVGLDYYLQAINATTMAVYDKEGNLVVDPFAANTLWTSLGFNSAGDPIVLFDQEANRWIMTEFTNGNHLLVGVSDTSDPLGSWNAYNFGTPNFPDYPKYGIWSNAYAVTTNEQGPSVLPAYFINRQSLLAGDSLVPIQRLELPGTTGGPGFLVGTPVDWSGMAPPAGGPIIMRLNDDAWGDAAEDRVELYTVELDWNDPSNTAVVTTSLPTTPYDSNPCSVEGLGFSCVPQGGTGGGLDGLPETIMNQPHYRNFGTYEALVYTFAVDVSPADSLSAMRWVELRRSPEENWEVYQEGTFAPEDGLDRYMGSIAMDGSGNIGLAYAVSSEEEFVGLRFTGRRAADPPGLMTVQEYELVEGTNTIQSNARFGDYFHMSIDPVDDRTFWFTGEYGGGGGSRSTTRIASFRIRRDTTDIGPTALLRPENSPNLGNAEAVQLEVTNLGLDTVEAFALGYRFEGELMEMDTIEGLQLEPDSVYQHTFDTPVDAAVIGSYNLELFTVLPGDQAAFNDTLRRVVVKQPRRDAGIVGIEGLGEENCVDAIDIRIELINFGALPLESADIAIELNGDLIETLNWSGNLPPGGSELIDYTLQDLIDGANSLRVSTSNPNGASDEVPANDAFERNFDMMTQGVTFSLLLTTDFFPNEITWQVAEEDGDIIAAGGPYADNNTQFVETFCLDTAQCYTFTIFDLAGDGICCGFGQGSYTIENDAGEEIVASTGEYGASESSEFCGSQTCLLTASVDISPESSEGEGDGVILLSAANNIGTMQYSINGGDSFQEEPLFPGLSAGTYPIVITDGGGCQFDTTVALPACALDFMLEVEPATDGVAQDGSILVLPEGGNLPLQYSIDGGMTFQSGNAFDSLAADTYTIVVRDSIGCTAEQEVSVLTSQSGPEQRIGHRVRVFPNPTEGVFRVEVEGIKQTAPFLSLEIYDASGQFLKQRRLARYGQRFTGLVSLREYPDGLYFLRLPGQQLGKMWRVVKEE